IVDEGQLTDPRARAYMLDTLIARQRKTARYWFAQVAPLDHFALRQSSTTELCFTDLLLAHDLGRPATFYELTLFDGDGRATSRPRTTRPGDGGQACFSRIIASTSRDGYTIARIRVARDGGEAEIEDDDLAGLVDEDVAGVQVGVHEAVV